MKNKKEQMYVFTLTNAVRECYTHITLIERWRLLMYKSFKFRLYPNKKQQELLNKSFVSSRFIYNYYLSNIKTNGYKNAYSNISDYVNYLKYEYPFLQEIDSTIIRKTLFHLDDNFQKFYNNNFGYPKYKSKFDKHSYTTSAIYRVYKNKTYCSIELDLEKRLIKLPKLKWINIRGYRNIKSINGTCDQRILFVKC